MKNFIIKLLVFPTYLIYMIISNPKYLNTKYNKTTPRYTINEFIQIMKAEDYFIAVFMWACTIAFVVEYKAIIHIIQSKIN